MLGHAARVTGGAGMIKLIHKKGLITREALFQKGGRAVKERNAIMIAADQGKTAAVQQLLEAAHDNEAVNCTPYELLREKGNDGKTALHLAAEKGNKRLIEAILGGGRLKKKKATYLCPIGVI